MNKKEELLSALAVMWSALFQMKDDIDRKASRIVEMAVISAKHRAKQQRMGQSADATPVEAYNESI